MKKVGKIIAFDGHYGVILDDEGKVDFCYRDFSEGNQGEVFDLVLFRKEQREDDVQLAKNIKVIKKTKEDMRKIG